MLSPGDRAFILKLAGIVIANLQDENFGVQELVREAGISRSVLHRRLRAITGQNISQFIREIRLKKAMELLQHHAVTASEAAYQVGFRSPSYFTKCFRELYGLTPGEVKGTLVQEGGARTEAVAEAFELFPQEEKAAAVAKKPLLRRRLVLAFAFIFVVLALALLSYRHYKGSSWFLPFQQQQDLSIIVLPFKNLSGDPGNQYFADGIMEDILNDLYRISTLRVISRTTAEHYRETTLTAREIAREVNARNVLEGSVRRQGNKVRISVQLIDANKDSHLWSANYDRKLADVMGVQSDIALKVALKLNVVISDAEIEQVENVATQNPEAYDNYLRARFLLNKANSEQRYDFTKEGAEGCLQYYEKAIAADEHFVEAYAGLANAWFNLAAWGMMPAKREGFSKAMEFSRKALQMDPDCAEAHAVLGACYVWFERRYEEGHKELVTAIQLDPDFPVARQWYAQLLMITGPIEEARVHMDELVEMEPFFWVVQNLNAWIYYFEGKNDKAIEACVLAHSLRQGYVPNNWLFVLNYAKLGEGEKAAEELQGILDEYYPANEFGDEIMEAYRNRASMGCLPG